MEGPEEEGVAAAEEVAVVRCEEELGDGLRVTDKHLRREGGRRKGEEEE